jgi:hypothetical protein
MSITRTHASRYVGAALLLALLATLLPLTLGSSSAEAAPQSNADRSHHGAIAERGTTAGWFDGRTIDFSYSKDFFCRDSDPQSRADSNCILGAEPQTAPRPADIPVAYVLVPLFEDTDGIDLHCPVAGDCINHPSTMDLSPVFGPGTENAALPPHSHVLEEKRGGWWEVEVNGVTTREAWDAIEDAKDLASVREQQAAGTVTDDIPTNLFLWFNTQG